MKLLLTFMLFIAISCSSEDNNSTVSNDQTTDTTINEENPMKPMYVEGRYLYSGDGEKIILRGVNLMSVWTDPTGEKLSEIAKTGSNCVRIVWTTKDYTTAAAIDTVIAKCIANNMIPMLENHDATGVWEELPKVIDWWLQDDLINLVKKYENYLLINIANEAGHSVHKSSFTEVYSDAVKQFRENDINCPIIIDATNYGKNIFVIQSEAATIIEADPISNVMFSVHMWWPKKYNNDNEGKVVSAIDGCIDLDIPLIVGEFGANFTSTDTTTLIPTAEDSIPYKLIMSECQSKEIGWLAWSWGPGNNPQVDLDMTENGMFETLHEWGLEVAITDDNSIKNTSIIPTFITKPLELNDIITE